MRTSELTGAALDWAVAKCLPNPQDVTHKNGVVRRQPVQYAFTPSTNWAQGGPIIARELINAEPHFLSAGFAHPMGVWEWVAYVLGPNNIDDPCEQHGPTPLVAAMRCYVASKLGDEVEVPEELK